VFPTEHVRRIIGAAREGKTLLQLSVYDGSDTGEKLYGGFYTQDDIREVVRYAANRHITIVPEIEIPGHSLAACASYPEIACSIPAKLSEQESGSPVPNVYCAGKEASFEFLQNVLDEVCDLFPSQIIHIGGDEVDKFYWHNCPDCQKRMNAEGLKNEEELQSYVIRRVEKYLNTKGKRIIGWDEILEGGLAPNAAVMSWRGIDGGITAAKAGHDVVMTPTSHCYFDYGYNSISTEHVLSFDPVPPTLTKEEAKHILGGQCNLWTEGVPDRPTVEQRLFPRFVSMAQVLWSENKEDPAAFMDRLQPYYARLQALGLNFFVPAPEAEYDAVFLGDSSQVAFRTPAPGMTIRYTEDASLPTVTSKVYSKPIAASNAGTITAANFMGSRVSEAIRIQVSSAIAASAGTRPGIVTKTYPGRFATMPDFAKLKESGTFTGEVFAPISDREDAYALYSTATLRIERDGIYTFYLNSDDGGILWLGGAKLIDNDGLHAPSEKKGRVRLNAGSYPIAVGYFQAGGAQTLKLSIEGPNMPKQEIPPSMLSH